MKIEKNRHLLILDALIQSDRALTAEKLAVLSRSSIRTIKSDIVYLNKLLNEEKIVKIVSSRAKGYEIEIINKEEFKILADEIQAMKRLYFNRDIEEINRRLYIVQRLLTEEHILVDDICESLFISRTLISKDIEWVKKFLETYDISVQSVSGKGIVINGDEISIRNAMVEIHYSQFYDHQQFYSYEPFNRMFYDDRQVYEDIRHELLKLIRDNDIPVPDFSAKFIPTYMCLAIVRAGLGKVIELDEKIKEELRNTFDYQIILKLKENELVGKYLYLPEIELINFAKVLMMNRDFDMRSKGMADIPMEYIRENTAIYNRVLKKSMKKLGKSLYNVEFYRFIELDVQSLQLQLYLKYHFGTTKRSKLATYVERDESLISPVALEMTRIMMGYLQEEFGQDIHEPTVTSYAAYYELVMKKIIYPYHRMKLLITATEGLVYAQSLKETILRKYGDYIDEMDAYNLYEMRKLNFDNYDALVHSGNMMYYKYPLKSISYDEIDYQKDDDSQLKEFLKQGFDRTRINEIKKFLRVERNVVTENPDFLIESLFYRYASNEDNRKALKEDFYKKRSIIDYYSSKQMSLMVMMDYKYVKKEVMDIYILDKPADYHGNLETKFLVMACLNPDNSVSSLKVDNYVLHYINQVQGVVDILSEDKEEALDRIYDRVIAI